MLALCGEPLNQHVLGLELVEQPRACGAVTSRVTANPVAAPANRQLSRAEVVASGPEAREARRVAVQTKLAAQVEAEGVAKVVRDDVILGQLLEGVRWSGKSPTRTSESVYDLQRRVALSAVMSRTGAAPSWCDDQCE